jgi:NDP-sugar pyrophosphorylase family protein
VVLAAGRGKGLEAVTTDRPKLMLPIGGRPLLGWLIESFKKEGVNDITVVGGYRAAAIDPSGIKLTVNERYAETGELASLECALGEMQSDTVVCYGICCSAARLRDLLEVRRISRSWSILRVPARSTARCTTLPIARAATTGISSVAGRCCGGLRVPATIRPSAPAGS